MNKFYKKLIGRRKIKIHKKEWKLFQKEINKEFNWRILGLIILIALYFLFPKLTLYISIALFYFTATLLIKFGEYKGYNECLYNLENKIEDENE